MAGSGLSSIQRSKAQEGRYGKGEREGGGGGGGVKKKPNIWLHFQADTSCPEKKHLTIAPGINILVPRDSRF